MSFSKSCSTRPGAKNARRSCKGEKGAAWISDFTLHSLGVLLFRQKRPELFDQFTADTLPQLTILSLSAAGYSQLVEINSQHGLDFDDAYQFAVARENNLAIATQDKDFQQIQSVIDVRRL